MRPRPGPALALAALAVAALTLQPLPATAQQAIYPTPRLTSVFPPGGKAGAAVEVTLDGTDLDGATALYFSTPALKAERLPDPPEPKDAKKKKSPPAPPPPARFRVTVAADAPVGVHDVRAIGKWGISNPRAFTVGRLPEVAEKEPNNDVPEAQRVGVNSVVNGVVKDRVDVDYVTFAGKAGQPVFLHCAASSIDSRLVASIRLFDAAGRELGSNRRYRGSDALLALALPADGDYLVRLCEFAYQRGGPDSFYRLTISTGPWVDAAFPPAVAPGKGSPVTLFGRNLPGGKPGAAGQPFQTLTVNVAPPATPDAAPPLPGGVAPRLALVDGFGYRLADANPVVLTFADGPLVTDNGDNDGRDKAQRVAVPCDICGRIERRGDRDHYLFAAKKGDVLVVEGFADRLRAPTDLFVQLRNAGDGKLLGEFDDHPEVPASVDRFFTRTDDPKGRVVIPADGDYELLVRSREAQVSAGPRHVYRVRVGPERPDYRLMAVGNHETGAGLTLRRGSAHEVRVVCLRQDGFDGEVTLAVEGLPAGVTCAPQVVGPKLREGSLVLVAAANAADWAGPIKVTGSAVIDGKKVVREARAGCLVYPTNNANAPAMSRLARSLCLAVRDPGPFRLEVGPQPVEVPVGGTAKVKVKAVKQRPEFKENVSVDLAAGPAQSNGRTVNAPKINVGPDKEGEVRIQVPQNAPPGAFNLVFRGAGKSPFEEPGTKKKRNAEFIAVTPPVKLTVYDSACELAFGPQPLRLRPGAEHALPVTVKRLHGYAGELRLELVVPNGVQGVSAQPATVPARAGEGKLVVRLAKEAKPVQGQTFVVRATAKIDNVSLKEEAKVGFSIDPLAPPSVAGKSAANGKLTKLLPEGSPGWRYAVSVQGDGWLQPDFDDKGWKEAKAPIGNGEPEVAARKGTEVPEKGQTLYVRRAFDVPADLLKQKGVTFRLLVASDNSAVVYVNGKAADDEPGDHEFRYWNRDVTLPVALLRPGRNVLAVRVNNAPGSSDVYLDAAVVAEAPAN